ncbi:MAG: hypothetical protein AAF719_02835 [Pseudomonadota bacterium]
MYEAALNTRSFSPERDRVSTVSKVALGFATIQIIVLVFLQKIGIVVGDGAIAISILVFLTGLAYLVFRGVATLQPLRFLLFAILACISIASQVLGATSFSILSILLLFANYVCFLFVIEVQKETYLAILKRFQTVMVIVAGLTFLQHTVQIVLGASNWPNMEDFIPPALLIIDFNYLQPLNYGSPLMKPNAFFFLETSFVSQFLALALIIELIWFNRVLVLVILGVAILTTFAGTGLLILVLMSPLFLISLSPRMLVASLVGLVAVTFAAGAIGWFDEVGGRITEFAVPGSSAHMRYVAPVDHTLQQLQRPEALYSGVGAGNAPENALTNSLPLTKAITEYGLAMAVALCLFVITSLFYNTPSLKVAWGFFVFYMLGAGALSLPIFILPMALFCTLFRFQDEPIIHESERIRATPAYAFT